MFLTTKNYKKNKILLESKKNSEIKWLQMKKN